ncbi:hypothetical protein GCM10022406_31900 [Hymenobacter algoricola]|uniref:Uncharacterized protein n=1 Tax=Hymenobacter algoricola TaxID=486267 RepID=A0ABP7NI81_9BACT
MGNDRPGRRVSLPDEGAGEGQLTHDELIGRGLELLFHVEVAAQAGYDEEKEDGQQNFQEQFHKANDWDD